MNNNDKVINPNDIFSEENSSDIKKEAEKLPEFCTADIVFAWLSFALGYMFCRTFPVFENPFGGFLFVLVAFIAAFIVLRTKKIKIPTVATVFGLSAIIVSATLFTSQSKLLVVLAFCYALASYCYFISASFGNSMENGFSDLIFMDYFKAIFLMPFYSYNKIFLAVSQGKAKNSINFLIKVLAGIVIATVPTVVILLLLSYDNGFTSILTNIFSFDIYTLFSHFGSLIFAVPIGMYIFGLYASANTKLMKDTITTENCKKGFDAIKILPQTTALTAVLPILFVYVIYFISQWKYYISGFTGILPEDFSYAEYARQGFFQLCAVSVMNLIIIVSIVIFMKRSNKISATVLKILTSVFCVFTLILISTAIAKLVMYIDCYGLTQKRIYAMWLMIVIASIYIIVALSQFVSRIKAVTTSISVCIILFTVLSLCNINGIIAEYNTDRYINGTLDTVDLYAMQQLEDSAIPSLVRLAEELEAKAPSCSITIYKNITDILKAEAESITNANNSVFSFTIPSYKAKIALKQYGLLD